MQNEIRFTKAIVRKAFSDKIDLITEIARYQWRLAGIYYLGSEAKKGLGLKYKENLLLMNVILTQPYWTHSVLLLTKNTLYGSARPALRQFFEALMISKFSEYDESLIRKWRSQKDEVTDRENTISLGNDVFLPIEKRGKPTKELRATWRDVNHFTHHTRWSQQMPRIWTTNEERIAFLEKSTFLMNIVFTLDLLFMLLCMYNHLLISHLGRKTYRWYMGYERDPFGLYKKERRYKEKIKSLIQAYFETNKEFPNANRGYKKRISEYTRSWSETKGM